MRRWSWRVCWGLARASSGSASAAVALWRQDSNSLGYTPCSRHQALLPLSSRAAVAITASSRAVAVQTRWRSGSASACARQRSKVAGATPSSRATVITEELSGGSKRATARSLNTCPYLAIWSPPCPQGYRAIEATTILTQGEFEVAIRAVMGY